MTDFRGGVCLGEGAVIGVGLCSSPDLRMFLFNIQVVRGPRMGRRDPKTFALFFRTPSSLPNSVPFPKPHHPLSKVPTTSRTEWDPFPLPESPHDSVDERMQGVGEAGSLCVHVCTCVCELECMLRATPEVPDPAGIWFCCSISPILGFQWLLISLGDFPEAKFPGPVCAPCPRHVLRSLSLRAGARGQSAGARTPLPAVAGPSWVHPGIWPKGNNP